MIPKLIIRAPLNGLSIGQFSFNILRELYKRKAQIILFPFSNAEMSAYKIDQQFGSWIERAVNSRYQKLDRNTPSLTIWHINGSESKYSDKQYLYTFHETDSPTQEEVNIINQQEHTFLSSQWSVDNFQTYGSNEVSYVPLGLDEDFYEFDYRQIPDDITHWVLAGAKWEQRKNTELIIKTWVKKYSENPSHRLTLMVNNPFFKPEQMNQLYSNALGGKKPFNVNILPSLKTNAEMNHLYNSADIDLSGLASNEGWNIPAHTCTCLGKWSIVMNTAGHKGWATQDNSILVEPNGVRSAADDIFFQKGGPFNQGNFYTIEQESILKAMEIAESKAKTPNINGRKLKEIHTYKNTVDQILAKIYKNLV